MSTRTTRLESSWWAANMADSQTDPSLHSPSESRTNARRGEPCSRAARAAPAPIARPRPEAMLPGVGRSGRSETTLGTAKAPSTPVSASVNDHTRPRGHTGAPGGAPQVRELGGLPTKHAAYTTESSLERACTSQTPSEQAKCGARFGIRRWL